MTYKKVLIPPDEEVIFEGWTWGDHRAMEKSLHELEMTDEQVRIARQRLDDRLAEAGIDPEAPHDKSHFVCEFCHRNEWLVHADDCPSFDPNDRTVRDAAAFQFMDENFQELHVTSACANNEEAIDYFRIVTIWFPNDPPRYVLRKEFDSETFHMIPFQFVDGEVIPIERPSTAGRS